jgi:succinoglycan biosynthesis protein ExoM
LSDLYDLDVCVCTFRRESVVETLRSISQQSMQGRRLRVIVADNDETPSAESRVRSVANETGLACTYLHAPARNISLARNACLGAATAPFVAFLDDDLVATPDWAMALLGRQAETGADVVFGLVKAVYPADAPRWTGDADMHSTRPTFVDRGEIVTGYTCNVLLRRAAIGGTRFLLELGRSGGEDTIFFHQLSATGGTFAYAPDALLIEDVDPSRLNMTWLLKRSFRAGQTHARIMRKESHTGASAMAMLAGKVAYCGVMAALTVWSPARWRRSLVRGALHAGAFCSLAGVQDLQLY